MPGNGRSQSPEPFISLIGCASLLGKEIKERLSASRLARGRVRLFETGAREGAVTDYAGEAALAFNVEPSSLMAEDLVILACPPAEADRILGYPRKPGSCVIDLSGGSASASAPVVNTEVNRGEIEGYRGMVRAPQPVSLMLSTVLDALEKSRSPLLSVEAVVFEPASGLGQEAIDELYQQAANLLNFATLPRETFGRQMAFNLVPLTQAEGLGGTQREEGLAREILRVLNWEERRLCLKILLAPVFHTHAALIRATPSCPSDASSLLASFENSESFDAVRSGEEAAGPATPVEWAGQEAIRIAEVREDSRGAFWVWALVDDLKAGAARNVVRIAEALFPF